MNARELEIARSCPIARHDFMACVNAARTSKDAGMDGKRDADHSCFSPPPSVVRGYADAAQGYCDIAVARAANETLVHQCVQNVVRYRDGIGTSLGVAAFEHSQPSCLVFSHGVLHLHDQSPR